MNKIKNNKNYTYSEFLSFKKERKKIFNIIFSFAGVILYLLYAMLHIFYYEKNYLMTIFLVSTSFLFTLNLIYLFFKGNPDLSANYALLVSILIIFLTTIFGADTDFRLVWFLIIPLLSYYLKAKIKGTVFIIIGLLLFFLSLILNQIGLIKFTIKINAYIDVLTLYVFISLATFYYEFINNENEEHILSQLYTDSLTKFFNRTSLVQDIKNNIANKLILINVDNFKHINDLYGNALGDLVLVEICKRLKQFKTNNYIHNIYKLHADEFALLFYNRINRPELNKLVNKLENVLNQEYYIENIEILISITMGISDSTSNILEEADMALKLAKENQVRFLFFENSMKIKEKFENNIIWVKKIKKSIAHDNIIPVFQPILNNKNNKIKKFECLIRMIDEDELILPLNFIEVAKKSKFYTHLTKIILLKSAKYFADKNFDFSINISLYDIYSKESTLFFTSIIDDYKIGEKLIFELTETEQIENNSQVNFFIEKVKERGCKIAIDDFGTGYSNFDYLLKMNVDILKLDGSLIKNINENKDSHIITETIVNFTKKLNIETIAEHVYSKEIFDIVKKLGIDNSQGFYIGKPEKEIDNFFVNGKFVLNIN
ncbi:MAG: GGDEF and EAL domain-containing protein [Candidatus Lokiarchaeota archaeon]|nr:GGDEF and EAL domain-containing protein [Candidatus Lokiarchaeota archaeon]